MGTVEEEDVSRGCRSYVMELQRRWEDVAGGFGGHVGVVGVDDVVVVFLAEIDAVLLDDVPDAALFAQDVVFGRNVDAVVGIVAKVFRLEMIPIN